MDAAIKKIDADKGMFFITPKQYLIRKMLFKAKSTFMLSNEVRKQMIDSLSSLNNKMVYGGIEIGGNSPSTVKTINSVRRHNKNAELYLLVGADKLRNLPKWDDIDSIIDTIKIIVAVRNGICIDDVMNNDQWLTKHRDRMILVNPDDQAFTISSSEVRNRFFNQLEYQDLMNEEPYKILKQFTVDNFKSLSFEDQVYYELKYNGRFGSSNARKMVFNENAKLFCNWDESILGNKQKLLNNTKVYKDQIFTKYNYGYETQTDCVNADCVDVALDLINNNYNPAILNLASNVSPGGGYHKGTSAQEESLCQMSTLSQSLYQFGSLKYKHIRDANLPNIPGVYPMDINYGGIYSPNVVFFRNNKQYYFSIRDKKFSTAVITIASLSNRIKNQYTNDERKYFNSDGTLTDEGISIEKNKIRTIYRIALDNGHDSIVLGAFGCGVYNLLPSEVSKLFFDVLNEDEFKGNFKKLVFAILEGKGKRGQSTGRDGKFKPFYDLFEIKK